MPIQTIFTLEASNVSVSGGQQLSGITQGDGSHLMGESLTLTSNDFVAVSVNETNDSRFDDSDNSQSLANDITYDGVAYSAGRRVEAEFGLSVEDPDGNIYEIYAFNINEPGVTSYSTVEGLGFIGEIPPIGVPLKVVQTREGESNAYDDLAAPVCFVKRSRIRAEFDEIPVELLRVGDRIETFDNGLQTIRWIGSRKINATALDDNPKLRPIRIVAGALGCGLPQRDLWISRQHRMVVSSRIVMRMCGQTEALVAANKLAMLPGIFVDENITEVEYFHIMFDRHEVIFAENAPTESLFAGAEALKSIPAASRDEIYALFPELKSSLHRPEAARLIPTNSQQSKLAMRHAKNRIGLLSAP